MEKNKRVRVGDIDTFYRWDGRPSGPVVMMAHAMGTSHRLWDAQVKILRERFRILRYDWRGHGATSAPAGAYTLAQFVDDACGLMDALELSAVHWVGISTGGMIGQGLGIYAPERLLSLALCNTTSQSTRSYRDWVSERQILVRSKGMVPVWEQTKYLWFTDAFADAEGPEYNAVREVFIRTPVAGYVGGTSAVANLAYEPELHRIRAPTLVLGAGADPVTPPDHTRAIHERIPNAQLAFIDGLRHFSNVEKPEAFTGILADFLTEVVEPGKKLCR